VTAATATVNEAEAVWEGGGQLPRSSAVTVTTSLPFKIGQAAIGTPSRQDRY